jgi:hypothetical protein
MNGFVARFELHEGKIATHVPEQINIGERLKTYGSGASQMLQFGFGPIVTKNA